MGSVYIQAVVKALKITEYLAQHGPSRISDMSRDLGYNKSTVFGLLKTLESENFVVQDVVTQTYRLTVYINELGRLALTHIPEQTMIYEAMYRLSQTHQETFHLVTRAGDEVIYINKVEAEQSIRVATSIGALMPMYCTSVGKAILMTWPNEEIEAYCDRVKFKRFTEHTLMTKEELLRDIEASRVRKYAIDDNEVQDDMFCAGVPVVLPRHECRYSLSISMPQFRRPQMDKDLVIQDMRRTAQELALVLYQR